MTLELQPLFLTIVHSNRDKNQSHVLLSVWPNQTFAFHQLCCGLKTVNSILFGITDWRPTWTAFVVPYSANNKHILPDEVLVYAFPAWHLPLLVHVTARCSYGRLKHIWLNTTSWVKRNLDFVSSQLCGKWRLSKRDKATGNTHVQLHHSTKHVCNPRSEA